jgi:hypothetical protein
VVESAAGAVAEPVVAAEPAVVESAAAPEPGEVS